MKKKRVSKPFYSNIAAHKEFLRIQRAIALGRPQSQSPKVPQTINDNPIADKNDIEDDQAGSENNLDLDKDRVRELEELQRNTDIEDFWNLIEHERRKALMSQKLRKLRHLKQIQEMSTEDTHQIEKIYKWWSKVREFWKFTLPHLGHCEKCPKFLFEDIELKTREEFDKSEEDLNGASVERSFLFEEASINCFVFLQITPHLPSEQKRKFIPIQNSRVIPGLQQSGNFDVENQKFCRKVNPVVYQSGFLWASLWYTLNYHDLPRFQNELKGIWMNTIEQSKQFTGQVSTFCSVLLVLISFTEFLETELEYTKIIYQLLECLLKIRDPFGEVLFYSTQQEQDSESRPKNTADLRRVHVCEWAPPMCLLYAKAFVAFRDHRYLQVCQRITDLLTTTIFRQTDDQEDPPRMKLDEELVCGGLGSLGYVYLILYRLSADPIHLNLASKIANIFLDVDNLRGFLGQILFESSSNQVSVNVNEKARKKVKSRKKAKCKYGAVESMLTAIAFLADFIQPDQNQLILFNFYT